MTILYFILLRQKSWSLSFFYIPYLTNCLYCYHASPSLLYLPLKRQPEWFYLTEVKIIWHFCSKPKNSHFTQSKSQTFIWPSIENLIKQVPAKRSQVKAYQSIQVETLLVMSSQVRLFQVPDDLPNHRLLTNLIPSN